MASPPFLCLVREPQSTPNPTAIQQNLAPAATQASILLPLHISPGSRLGKPHAPLVGNTTQASTPACLFLPPVPCSLVPCSSQREDESNFTPSQPQLLPSPPVSSLPTATPLDCTVLPWSDSQRSWPLSLPSNAFSSPLLHLAPLGPFHVH
jgi:hypothetical protein